MLHSINAISPIDGRYKNTVSELAQYSSEAALIKYRVKVEIDYFIALVNLPLAQLKSFDKSNFQKLKDIYINFTENDALDIKAIEKETNHDVKAVEYFIKKRFDDYGLSQYKEFIHFGLTSQDINNTSIPLMFKNMVENVYVPAFESLIDKLKTLSLEWKDISMLAFTHGQPASPTKLGKEINVFIERLEAQYKLFLTIPFSAKFGGATGNFNAHKITYPEINWIEFGNSFVKNDLGLQRSQFTTQIEHYDNFAAHCDNIKRINNIIIDLDRDFWTYISMNYFRQQIKAGEVGSSAMPHKVNPIDFENSEGNLGIANALFEHFAAKLPISRLQRDLTDSTVLRNIGVPMAHSLIALKSTIKGLNKLLLNKAAIDFHLEENWAVVAEAIQTILRREGYENPYEALKALTRTNEKINQQSIHKFIDSLIISNELKAELKTITPHSYTGY